MTSRDDFASYRVATKVSQEVGNDERSIILKSGSNIPAPMSFALFHLVRRFEMCVGRSSPSLKTVFLRSRCAFIAARSDFMSYRETSAVHASAAVPPRSIPNPTGLIQLYSISPFAQAFRIFHSVDDGEVESQDVCSGGS